MSGAPPIIRDGEEADVPAIAAIYAHAVRTGRASFELAPPGEDKMRSRRAALVASGHPYLVAERDGEVLGYAYAGPYRPRAAYGNTVENSVYVREDRQGLGLGRTLLAALIAACEAQGYRQMVAVIGDSANRGSIRLHEAMGFAMVGTLRSVGRKHGLWLDTVLMQRSLGPGDGTPPARE